MPVKTAEVIRPKTATPKRTYGILLTEYRAGTTEDSRGQEKLLAGSLLLKHLAGAGSSNLLHAALGAILAGTASVQIVSFFQPARQQPGRRDRSPRLAWLMLPVGAEVGFASAGAGALGSAALMSLTALDPAQVAGTDIVFGFVVSLIGSGAHWFTQAGDPALLLHLVLGGAAGAGCGILLSERIPRRPLRLALWVWLLLLGLQFLFSSYRAWASPAARDHRAPSLHGFDQAGSARRGGA